MLLTGYFRVGDPPLEKANSPERQQINDLLYRLNSISHTLLSLLKTNDLDVVIDKILTDVQTMFHGGRAYIIEFDRERRTHDCTYEVTAENVTAEQDLVNSLSMDEVPWWTRRIDADSQSWEEYATAIKPLTADVAADACLVTPTIWGPELGTLMGRLCNAAVTVADSPMRVATGALVGSWTERPVDKAGRRLDMSVLEGLDKARFSVPQWYPDYEGMYWADGNVLDVNGGDFQVIENVRVIMKAMRRVYPLAVARIADRRFNSTPASIAQNKTYFMRPLREMSRSVTILGQTFPGEIYPPEDGDITVSWPSRTSVELYMAVRPYNCPKKITCNLFLDLNNYAA